MDNSKLVEQVVKRQRNAKYWMNVFLILLAAIAIPLTLIVVSVLTDLHYLSLLALFVLLFCIYGAWFFISSLKVEYEYAFLSSTMRIDKIIAKRRRRKMIKLDVKQITDIFRFSDDEMTKRDFTKIYHAEGKEYDENNIVIAFNLEDKGSCAAIFTPNEEFISTMKPYCNYEIRKKLSEIYQ